MILPIVAYGAPVLRTVAKEITHFFEAAIEPLGEEIMAAIKS